MGVDKKFELLSARTRYLKKDLEISNEIMEEATILFRKLLFEKIGEAQVTDHQTQKNDIQKKENIMNILPLSVKKKKDTDLNRLFKKIVSCVHPDKLIGKSDFERKYKKVLFSRAIAAANDNDYYTLSEVADELGVEIPRPTKKHIDIMKTSILVLEEKIKKIKDSFPWVWYHEESQDKKELLLERYIEIVKQKNSGS